MSATMTEPVRANRELVVYCLYVAGGATERVHTEDLALKCWELFPDSFSWTKYPQHWIVIGGVIR
jgi:hypothetical protein